jgi:hypothetical protein
MKVIKLITCLLRLVACSVITEQLKCVSILHSADRGTLRSWDCYALIPPPRAFTMPCYCLYPETANVSRRQVDNKSMIVCMEGTDNVDALSPIFSCHYMKYH